MKMCVVNMNGRYNKKSGRDLLIRSARRERYVDHRRPLKLR